MADLFFSLVGCPPYAQRPSPHHRHRGPHREEPWRAVGAGEAILILESMKMEMPLESPVDGRVKEIRVKEGQSVAEGDVLAVVE